MRRRCPGRGGAFWAIGEAAAGALLAHPFPGAPGPKQPAVLQLAVTSSPEFSRDGDLPRGQPRPQVRGIGTGIQNQGGGSWCVPSQHGGGRGRGWTRLEASLDYLETLS